MTVTMKHVCKNERPWTDLVNVDHEDLRLRCGPRTLKVIHLGYAKVLVVGRDHQGQLAHVFVQDPTNTNRQDQILGVQNKFYYHFSVATYMFQSRSRGNEWDCKQRICTLGFRNFTGVFVTRVITISQQICS